MIFLSSRKIFCGKSKINRPEGERDRESGRGIEKIDRYCQKRDMGQMSHTKEGTRFVRFSRFENVQMDRGSLLGKRALKVIRIRQEPIFEKFKIY